jgi:hypothetical protein
LLSHLIPACYSRLPLTTREEEEQQERLTKNLKRLVVGGKENGEKNQSFLSDFWDLRAGRRWEYEAHEVGQLDPNGMESTTTPTVTPGFRRQTECKPCTCQDQQFTYIAVT